MPEATTRPSRTVWMPFTPSSDVPGSAGTTWPRVPNALSSEPDARSLITNSWPAGRAAREDAVAGQHLHRVADRVRVRGRRPQRHRAAAAEIAVRVARGRVGGGREGEQQQRGR